MLGKRKRSALYLLRLPSPTLAAFTDHQPHRIHFCYRPITNSANQRLWFTNRDLDDGLQTWSGSPKALAPAAGLRTDPKGRNVRSQAISGNGGHDHYGRCEKVPVPKVKEIGD